MMKLILSSTLSCTLYVRDKKHILSPTGYGTNDFEEVKGCDYIMG